MTPVDIIAQAIRAADGQHTMGAGQLADVAAGALTDDRVVDRAVEFLIEDGWTELNGGVPISDDDLRGIALAVLRSVGGA